MWWLIGYVVSIPLAYVAVRSIYRQSEEKWTLRNRLQMGFGSLAGPLMFVLILCAIIAAWISEIEIDWDKEAKW